MDAVKPEARDRKHFWLLLIVVTFAAAVYIGCMISPPRLMDDVDAVQAQIAVNMVRSGDWVTARLDGVAYLEKSPLIYWLIAISYKIFGIHDWAARVPVVLSSIVLAWLTAAFGMWAFGKRAGFYAGLCMATCAGLFLFTRIQIPDVMVAACMAVSMWSFLRTIEEEERRPRLWAGILAASIGVSLLLKSLIGAVFPIAAAVTYLCSTGQITQRKIWKRLHVPSGIFIALAIAVPWHVLATLRNPPYFDFSLRSIPGQYHGFLWFYFMNEQVLRFLNLRSPRDYNTVPRLWFWLLHLVWLFPWSVYLPAVAKLSFKPMDRAGRTRLLALCWTGFILVFFTFSTTQEYYSMPCYPALALLIGSAMAAGGEWIRRGTRALSVILAVCAILAGGLWFAVRHVPTPGDIASALSAHPQAYTLSLGHIEDLTITSLAYLRAPLLVAAIACLIGAIGTLRWNGLPHTRLLARAAPLRPFADEAGSPVFQQSDFAFLSAALMAVLFFQSARMALVAFDPYMGSYALAQAINDGPPGKLIVDHHYYDFSSVFFYTGRDAFLLNGRFNNLVYGSYAPGAPQVFIDDAQLKTLWQTKDRYYLVADASALPRFEKLVGEGCLHMAASSGGKLLLTNLPLRAGDLKT